MTASTPFLPNDALPDVTVVILSYQVRELLRECLANLTPLPPFPIREGGYSTPAPCHPPSLIGKGGRGVRFDLIVVDNASTDGSAELVRREFPGVCLIETGRNLGFSAANNLGLRAARGRYVLLLNADARLTPGALATMVAFMDRRPDVGLCGARLIYPDGRDQDCAFDLPTLTMAFLDVFPLHHRLLTGRLNGRHRVAGRTEPFPIGHPLGACMLVRRAAFATAGLLDEGYFMYAEEVDWCIRLRRAGWGIYCVPTAVVVHHGGASAGQFRERMLVELYRSRYRLFRQHFSPAYQLAARLIFRAGHRWAIRRLRRAARDRPLTTEEQARLRAHRRILALR